LRHSRAETVNTVPAQPVRRLAQMRRCVLRSCRGWPAPGLAMSFRNYLSACLCFKNSASYLAEWLAFHATLGVEHFYLYNNESTDRHEEVIASYVAAGVATVIDFPGRGVQHAAFTHCLQSFGVRTRWMMFCDDDEFLFPVQDVSLGEALAPYETFAGVAVAWMLYGTSGHWARPRGLVIDNYAMRFAVPDHHVKCIVDPRRVVRPLVAGHQFECVPGEAIVDEIGRPIHAPLHPQPSANILRINHYLTKSRTELIERRRQVQVNTGTVSPLSIDEWLQLEVSWNQVRDPIAARYGERVRAGVPWVTGGMDPSPAHGPAFRFRVRSR
jgi:hypothetical protein